MKSLGNTSDRAFKEFLVEYTNEGGAVYVNALDQDDFWEEIHYIETSDAFTEAEKMMELIKGMGYDVSMDDLDSHYEDFAYGEDLEYGDDFEEN